MQKKKGISLIVLVITIIVMIILAAAIILSLNNAGIIGNANQAVFKQNVKNYLNELDLYYMDALIDNSYTNTKNIKATATTTPSITDLIPSMSEEDKTKFRVAGGNLIYMGANRSEYEWCRELDIMIDSTNLSYEQYNALYAEEIAYIQTIGEYQEDPFSGERGFVLTGTPETDALVLPYETNQIGTWGFLNRKELKSIILPNGLESIADGAFDGCSSLEYLILPDTVKYINSEVFWGCKAMKYLELPDNLKSIGTQAFQDCTGLEEVTFPQGIQTIFARAFANCTGLTEVTIPASVTSTYAAFTGCTNLKAIKVEEGNTKLTSEDGVLYNIDKTTIVNVPASRKGVFTIPDTVKTIGRAAFGGCSQLTEVKIPNSVAKIDYDAFEYCTGLEKLTIPESVTKIGDRLFDEYRTFESFKTVYIESTAFARASDIGQKAFYGMAEGSTIYVRNATIASYLSGKYDATKTTISTDYNW